jgi:type I restriction enzyme, S subunit
MPMVPPRSVASRTDSVVIKAAKLKRLPIAVPPLAEQRRIAAKIDEMMALCDRLEAQLTAARTEGSRLLEALLHEALASAA